MSVTKQVLSGSTDGMPIPILTSSTTVHTASSVSGEFDEVWLFATNTTTADIALTVFWGATGANNSIVYTVAKSDGLKIIVPGNVLKNSKVITATGAAAGVSIHGYVNRIKQ